jgi:16S rRNA (uracil1498-N3)-methyltransferase
VGPEGGFTDNEVNNAIENGCVLVTIGSNILRTETAAIAAITSAAYEYQL